MISIEPVYVGIDPGFHGAVVITDAKLNLFQAIPTPLLEPPAKKPRRVKTLRKAKKVKLKRFYDVPRMVEILTTIRNDYPLAFVVLEQGQAMRKQGVTSMFCFGHGCGLWEGILTAVKLPFIKVRGSIWHRRLCSDIVGSDPKEKALKLVREKFPSARLRVTDRCTKAHDGIVDAACLALYSREYFSTLRVSVDYRTGKDYPMTSVLVSDGNVTSVVTREE